jgi:hypothetical protein
VRCGFSRRSLTGFWWLGASHPSSVPSRQLAQKNLQPEGFTLRTKGDIPEKNQKKVWGIKKIYCIFAACLSVKWATNLGFKNTQIMQCNNSLLTKKVVSETK